MLRSYVAGTLWPESTEEAAAGNLRTALWRLGQAAPNLVDTQDGYLSIPPDVPVDYRKALELARRILDRAEDVENSELDLSLFERDLVPGRSDEWVVVERERFRQLRLHALEAISERFMALGSIPRAVEAALAAVAGEPLRESAHRTLIRAHLAEGNRSEALRQYRVFRDLLQHELGVGPSSMLQELVADLHR